jgi:hypothetical protein
MECGLLSQGLGGLGVRDLEVKNSALLYKWLLSFLLKTVSQTLLKRKYIGSKALSEVLWKP